MKKLPPNNTGKKYLVRRSPKINKFIDIYVSGYGELTATECAIRAGYEKSSAHTRAHELLDWRQNPEVTREIDEKLKVHKAIWMVDKEKHLANLTRIGNEARAKGLYGVAGKMEELKGRAQGFYVDRNITMTKEITEGDLDEKLKRMFPDRKMFTEVNMKLADKIFGVETEEDKKNEAKKEKESKEKLAELDQYQEDRKKSRDRNYRKLAKEDEYK